MGHLLKHIKMKKQHGFSGEWTAHIHRSFLCAQGLVRNNSYAAIIKETKYETILQLYTPSPELSMFVKRFAV